MDLASSCRIIYLFLNPEGQHQNFFLPGASDAWEGDLTLHGRTQPVIFDIAIDVYDALDDPGYLDDDRPARIHLSGTGQVNRLEFDMRSHRIMVSQTVRLCLSVDLVPWQY